MVTAAWRARLTLGLAVAVVIAYVVSVRQVDLAVFLRAGHDVAAGRDPYPRLDSPLLRTNAAYVYPIAVAYLFAPIAASPGAVLIFDLVSGAALIGGMRLLGVRDPVIIALAVLATPALIGLQDGTVNAFLFLTVAAAWHWRERPVVAGLLVAAAVLAKVFLWPLVLWLLVARRYRSALVAVVAGGVVGGVGFLAGPLSLSGYDRLLTLLSHLEAPNARSIVGFVLVLGGSYAVASALGFAAAGVAVVAAGSLFRVGRVGEVAVLASCLAAALFASPVVWEHYYVLLLVPLLILDQSVLVLLAVAIGGWLASTPGGGGPLAAFGDLAAILVIGGLHRDRWLPVSSQWARTLRPTKVRRPLPPAIAVLALVGLAITGLLVVPGSLGTLAGAALPIAACAALVVTSTRVVRHRADVGCADNGIAASA